MTITCNVFNKEISFPMRMYVCVYMCVHSIRWFSATPSPVSSWHLVQVLQSIGMDDFLPDHPAERIHLSYAAQLEGEGLWQWTLFVLLQITDAERHALSHLSAVLHYSLSQVVHACAMYSDDFTPFLPTLLLHLPLICALSSVVSPLSCSICSLHWTIHNSLFLPIAVVPRQ